MFDMWDVEKEITNLQDLESDTHLNKLINADELVSDSVAWFCIDMKWYKKQEK